MLNTKNLLIPLISFFSCKGRIWRLNFIISILLLIFLSAFISTLFESLDEINKIWDIEYIIYSIFAWWILIYLNVVTVIKRLNDLNIPGYPAILIIIVNILAVLRELWIIENNPYWNSIFKYLLITYYWMLLYLAIRKSKTIKNVIN